MKALFALALFVSCSTESKEDEVNNDLKQLNYKIDQDIKTMQRDSVNRQAELRLQIEKSKQKK